MLPHDLIGPAGEGHVKAMLPETRCTNRGSREEPCVVGTLDPPWIHTRHPVEIARDRTVGHRGKAHGHVRDKEIWHIWSDRGVVTPGIEPGRDHVRIDTSRTDLVCTHGEGLRGCGT